MTRYLPFLPLLGLVACGTGNLSESERVTSSGARVLTAQGPLTLPSAANPAAVAAAFVHGRNSRAEVAMAAEVAGRGGVTHVRLEQRAGGLRVYGAYAKVAVSARGEVLQLIDALAPGAPPKTRASIGAREALTVAMAELGYDGAIGAGSGRGNITTFEVSGDFHRAPTVEQVAFPSGGGLAEGYLVETWSGLGNQLDHTLVDGKGAIVSSERRTANDRYNVFQEDPLKGGQMVVSGPVSSTESPAGWLSAGSQSSINITGNNAHAYLDTDANNAPDQGGTAVTSGDFLTAADLSVQPSTAGNKEVATQNLFYLNNVVHDILYSFGFNETAGNFQTNNFGRGGAGNDSVNAEAQDGSGTDNANFSTPADGSSPRMQMYLWSGNDPTGLVTVSGTDYGAYASAFGSALTLAGVSGALQVYNDGTGVASDGCEAATVALTGKLALVDRGTCSFTIKVLNAQKAGAIGVVLINNAPGAFSPGGTERRIKIPSGMVSQADGTVLRAQAGTLGSLRKNPIAPKMVDGDVDSDIVYHEYGHGLTWRMIGGMSGPLAGAIGEGASDVTAFLINGDDRIGEYSYANALGIRRYPYAAYPLTYRAVDGGEVHNDGEVYAGAMWRVMENYLAAGFTVSDLNRDFVDGMNFTPSTPAFEDMRDGMLQSAAGTGRECLIWRGFAASGIGVGADGQASRRGRVTIVESFALPPGC